MFDASKPKTDQEQAIQYLKIRHYRQYDTISGFKVFHTFLILNYLVASYLDRSLMTYSRVPNTRGVLINGGLEPLKEINN